MSLKVTELSIPGVLTLESKTFHDERGFFFESWNQRAFDQAIGRSVTFAQDNVSHSRHGVVRGLHYQLANPQAKLVRAFTGRIFDVAVDLRHGSVSFGEWLGIELVGGSPRALWIPEGFAHGFMVLSADAVVCYKATRFYDPSSERSILWSDPDIGIEWPALSSVPVVSRKDGEAPFLRDADLDHVGEANDV